MIVRSTGRGFTAFSAAAVALAVIGVTVAGARASGERPSQVREDPGATRQATGIVKGTVTLAGTTLPSPTRVRNSTDPEVCGREHSLQDMEVAPKNRGIRWVIASLVDVPDIRIPERAPDRLVIDNRDCRFVPHVAVAEIGGTVVAYNSDPILHNTHYYGSMRSNIALPERGMTVSRVARLAGLVHVLCDVHGWMKAYIRIDPHAYHDVTDSLGRFTIEGVPPGGYTLELWHEKLGIRRVEVQVDADRVTAVEVEYPAPTE